MLSVLYNIVIMPLVLIMEFIFYIGYRISSNPGLAIIGVSLGVNLLSFPLYKRADAIQDEERNMQKKMAPYVKHIRKSFKGDERFMILQTYYRQQGYSPLMVFRGSLPLLLQIPFFTAAYRYLSNLSLLQGTSFFIFKDLSAPDQLIHIGGLSLNLLPILMTLINFISGFIYTRGFRLKDKAQLYLLALFFLVFLYHCPSGLVFYWTLNNLFSLCKNIFMKLVPNPKKVLAYLLSVVSLVVFAAAAEKGDLHSASRISFMILVFIVCNIPIVKMHCSGFVKRGEAVQRIKRFLPESSSPKMAFITGAFLTAFMGAIIPLTVIGASTIEFVDITDYVNPLVYMTASLSICAGYFLWWGGAILYGFADEKGRRVYNLVLYIISICAVINFMCFNRNFGSVSIELLFDRYPSFTLAEIVINLLVLLVVIIAAVGAYHKFPKIVEKIYVALLLGSLLFVGFNVVKVNTELAASDEVKEAKAEKETPQPFITLSRTGKNVIVLMLDRAISGYVPYMFNENEELKEQFEGFTYYPNTISFGEHTNFGAPAIFGGYEYTPTEMNKRDEEFLVDKTNEALKVMPKLFSDNGYNVTVTDPPDAGYTTTPDLSIYDGMDGVNAVNTENGEYYEMLSDEEKASYFPHKRRNRNLFFYSLYRVMPRLLQPTIYDKGKYFSLDNSYITKKFLKRYAVLSALEKETTITDDDQDQFLMMQNSTPHNPVELQLPDYKPVRDVKNSGHIDSSIYTLNGVTAKVLSDPTPYHYHVNMASFMRLGEWFDYLREEGVYDNTRIIIVSDHGYGLGQFDNMIMDDGLDVEAVNPLLLYKDFADTESETDNSFMTNADVPTLAMTGLIDDMTNPYTGKEINSDEKTAHDQVITTSNYHSVKENNGKVFDTSDRDWYSVHDNIFESRNWTNLGSDYKAEE